MICKKCGAPSQWVFVVELPYYAANTWACESDKEEVRAAFDERHRQHCAQAGVSHLWQPAKAEPFVATKKTSS